MKKCLPIILIIIFATVVVADKGDIEIYRPNEVFDLSVHLTNRTGNVLGATCSAEIRNSSYGVLDTISLNEIDGGWYNGTYNRSDVGKFFCSQNCTQGTFFAAETCDFVIEGNQQMPIAVIITVIFVIFVYFFILVRLITEREFTEHGLIKLLFYMTAFWILLLPLNMAIQYNDFEGGPVVVTEHLELLYQIMVYINFFIGVYFFLWVIVQLLKKIGNTGTKLKLSSEK